jgi:murein DD-endopeptidase MepM/ murein hydrolase activator NlpD
MRPLLIVILCALVVVLLLAAQPQSAGISGTALPVEQQEETNIGGTIELNLTTDRQVWAYDFLTQYVGNSTPSLEIIALVVAWQDAENTSAAFNPLATTEFLEPYTCFNSLPSVSCGVKNYESREQGLLANYLTLTNGYYPNMLAALETNDPARFFNEQELTTWGGTSTYTALAGSRYAKAIEELIANVENIQPIVAHAEPVSQPLTKCPFTDTMEIGAGSGFYDTADVWGGQFGGMHMGEDYIGKRGDLVYAPYDMTISSVDGYWDPNDSRYGGNIIACFDHGPMCMYAGHLIETYVETGQHVKACDPIGALGATTWPHVHITFRTSTAACEASKPEEPGGCYQPSKYWSEH